ncbi:MAG TPA: hypothetical protein DEA08_38075, partial [Planctomycetes bacterium]|nr:hypothetical protein [Planctomycetota bacterium]
MPEGGPGSAEHSPRSSSPLERPAVLVSALLGFTLLVVVPSALLTHCALRSVRKPTPPATPSAAASPQLTPPALARSERYELGAVASVGTPSAQTGWVLPPRTSPSWDQVQLPPRPAAGAALLHSGRALAQRLCASCHGAEGRGDGVLAADLVRPPRDLSAPLRTRDRSGPPSGDEVFRSLSAGAPRQGMPSFAHLPAEERWALSTWVLSLQPDSAPAERRPQPLPPRPTGEPDLHLGQDVFRASCSACHGAAGRGDGPLAGSLRDASGAPCPPPDLTQGAEVLRGGARVEDLARTILLGRAGTTMAGTPLPPAQLWAVAAYVQQLGVVGRSRRARDWNAFFSSWRPLEQVEGAVAADASRFNARLSRRWRKVPAGRPASCLGCHEGLSEIASGTMQRALEAFGAGRPAGACVVCHEGNPAARTKSEAHAGLIGNPGSLWATSVGAGCAKCHSAPGDLRSLHGEPLPEPAGGRLMHVRSRQTDPSGATSGHYTYRVQRSLMAQETGKVLLLTSSVDLADPAQPTYSDFPLVGNHRPEPWVGSSAYRSLVSRGLESGYLQRLDQTQGVPTFERAVELCTGDEFALGRAALVDYGRKNCFRCHVWGEGKAARLEHRSSGCSACHVVWGGSGVYEGRDRTIPRRRAGHPQRHRLVMTPPDSQCNHCHTRNPYTEHSEPHQIAGMGCVDCHTSIDMHGDGNVYPSMEHQVEVRCEDCHGTSERRPWELPLGYGTPLSEGAPRDAAGRGTYGEGRHLLSNRGNPRRNWTRVGDKVVIESFLTGKKHEAPLLPRRPAPAAAGQPGCAAGTPGHEEVSCSLCHNRAAPRCTECHMDYSRSRAGQDWLLSALAYDPRSARQRDVFTPGTVSFTAEAKGSVPFGPPDTRRDRA